MQLSDKEWEVCVCVCKSVWVRECLSVCAWVYVRVEEREKDRQSMWERNKWKGKNKQSNVAEKDKERNQKFRQDSEKEKKWMKKTSSK